VVTDFEFLRFPPVPLLRGLRLARKRLMAWREIKPHGVGPNWLAGCAARTFSLTLTPPLRARRASENYWLALRCRRIALNSAFCSSLSDV
jgi:hypothetical protein